MRARAHMAQVLEGTGLYSLTGSTPVDWELDAYSAGFAPLEAAFDKLLADLFAATATRERLAQWEALFRPQPSTAPVEDCRDTVASRMAARPGDFTQAGTQRLLPGAGVRGLVLEDGEGGLKVLLGRLLGITQAEAARELDQLLPAHLAWAWDTAVTWVALDAYPRSFEAWDDLGLTWALLDGVSRQDLENGFEEV